MNNYILAVSGTPYWFTLPLPHSSPHPSLEQLIRELGDLNLLNTKKST